MDNTPQDLSGIFNEDISAKESITNRNAQGMSTIAGLDYTDFVHPDNPDHVLAHGIVGPGLDPIPAVNTLLTDTYRAIQTYLHICANLSGALWATLDSVFGGAIFTGPVSFANFKLASASGKVGTFYCRGAEDVVVDPRNTTVWTGVTRETDIFSPFITLSQGGAFVLPFCLVRFHDSVIDKRVQPRVVKPDFTGLPDVVSSSDTFTVEFNQNIDWAVLQLDSEIPVTAEFLNVYFQPPSWVELHDQYPVSMKENVVVYTPTDWGNDDKKIELKDGDGASCRCSEPRRDKNKLWGSFKFEVSLDNEAHYFDLTADLESGNFPRFVISGKMRSTVKTHLWVGPITGDPRDFTIMGITHIRVRYCYPVANFGVDGAHHNGEQMCTRSRRDYMNFVGNKTTIRAKDINSLGDHFFCEVSAALNDTNAANYTWDCVQRGEPTCGGCPFFTPRVLNRLDEYSVGQITSGQGWNLKQSAPGTNTVMDWVWTLIDCFGILWLLDPEVYFQSAYEAAYVPVRNYKSGQFMMVDADVQTYDVDVKNDADEVIGHDTHVLGVAGAFWNRNASTSALDFDSNRFPADVFGVLKRRISDALMAQTQLSEERSGSNDTERQIFSERLGRKPALAYRDQHERGSDLAFSARDSAGIEGENRLQRLFSARRFVSGIVKETLGTQGDLNSEFITIVDSPVTVGLTESVKAWVQLRPDGRFNYGHKRIGGWGVNGEVWRFESLGDNLFAVHCSPGQWNSTKIVGLADDRHTEDEGFFAGGNVVEILPPHFAPNGAYGNNINNVLLNGGHGKAVRGDTCRFFNHPLFPFAEFKIVEAKACGGDAFSGTKTDLRVINVRNLGTFVRMDEYFADAKVTTLVITNYETQFTGTVLGLWDSVVAGPERVIPVLNRERLYNYTGPGEYPYFLEDSPWMYFDLAQITDDTKYQNITSIYNGGATNEYRTVIVTEHPHGQLVGNVISCKETPAGKSNGNHKIFSVFSPTILVSERTGLTPDGEGSATGKWIAVKANNQVQVGSGRLYPSLPVFGWIISREEILLLGYNKIRISFDADGVAQTPKIVTILGPHVDLPHTPVINDLKITHYNRVTGMWESMSFGGYSFNDLDLFQGQTYLTFKYNNVLNRLYFHPLLTGDDIVIQYRTSDELDLDAFPDGGVYYRSFQTPAADPAKRGYLKRCDKLVLFDDSGLLASVTADGMLGAEFAVSGGLSADSVSAVLWSPAGEATWTVLDSAHWVFNQPLGKILLKASAFTILPANFNLAVDGVFPDRSSPTSAEFIKMLVAALGCLDTIGFGITIHDIGFVGMGANFSYGFTDITPNTGFASGDSVPHGTPGNRGLYDYDLINAGIEHGVVGTKSEESTGGLQRVPSAVADGAKHIFQINADNYWFSPVTFVPPDGPGFQIGAGVGGNTVGIAIRIWELEIPDCMLRENIEILDALLEVYFPPDTTFYHGHSVFYQRWDGGQTNAGGTAYGGLTGSGVSVHGDEVVVSGYTAEMPGAFALIGFDKTLGASGAWVSLGAFKDIGGGDFAAGFWRVIRVKNLFTQLASSAFRNSKYTKFAIYPTPSSATPASTSSLDAVGYNDVGLLDSIVKTYDTMISTKVGDDYRFESDQWNIVMNHPIAFGAGIIQFKLDTSEIKTLRINYNGSFPALIH